MTRFYLISNFQHLNQEQLAWVDRSGIQHTLAKLGNNSCDDRSLTMMTDVGEINDMTKLPLFKIMYGPLQESAQMIIHVGPLECLPKGEDQRYSLKNSAKCTTSLCKTIWGSHLFYAQNFKLLKSVKIMFMG